MKIIKCSLLILFSGLLLWLIVYALFIKHSLDQFHRARTQCALIPAVIKQLGERRGIVDELVDDQSQTIRLGKDKLRKLSQLLEDSEEVFIDSESQHIKMRDGIICDPWGGEYIVYITRDENELKAQGQDYSSQWQERGVLYGVRVESLGSGVVIRFRK